MKRRTGDAFFKGHRLVTFINDMTRQATIELDDREILAKEDVAEIGKINTYDLDGSVLYMLHLKTRSGCGSNVIVHAMLTGDSGKNQILSDFAACNDLVEIQLTTRKGWALWAAVAYRNDRPTARIAYVIANKLESQEIKAPSCLFTRVDQLNCLQSLVAEAFGSGELGLPTGSGSAADHKVETFHNKQTGKATLKLDNRVFRTFDNAKDFFLASVEGGNELGLFVLFLRPATGCATRPLLFFADRKGEPSITMDYAPCADRMASLTSTKGAQVQWMGLAFKAGEPRGYIASVLDRKLTTRTTMLPACMLEADKMNDNRCVSEALGKSGPQSSEPPQLRVIPMPLPGAARKPPPRTQGI
ncbi:hypothetical protein OZ411_05625 [Bradyrhizobium sp. Arg237L]|uniref:hypothetical protein n=2 Tax=unclassified Bradyrhizobium TaxID=2631580 RepID=UPI00249F1E5D|nr:hypothetical protein [Bradyrhizobium sp. Arg237L]MDI4232294.1 hypothetical protein [Bradyrhizobium sp. Arg237L]